MRTIETDRAVVEIIAWPEDRPWTGRYQTSSQIEGNLCTLTLSPDVFHDAAKANTAYRRFARKISREGMEPPNVVFRNMLSRASRNIFCILTTTESVFNSACSIGGCTWWSPASTTAAGCAPCGYLPIPSRKKKKRYEPTA